MFPFFNPFFSRTQSARSKYQASRVSGELYYKDNLLDRSKTPRQCLSDFPELNKYLPLMERYRVADATLQSICAAKGLQFVQNIIDSALG